MLSGLGYEVTGIDTSESGIAIAGRRVSDRLHFETATVYDDLASRFGRFPIVVSLEVIEHLMLPRAFMKTFQALLAPGGLGIISTPYHGYLKNLAIVAAGKFDHHFDPLWEGGHVKFFTRAKLGSLLAEFGFHDTQYHRLGRVPALAKTMLAVVRSPERT
jgi:2-polyprenyl-6-hydroxyphenyl methylase/3-demethylubiquinone-9 3-methyltransferase